MFLSLPSNDIRSEASSAAENSLVPAAWPSGMAQFGTPRTCGDGAMLDVCEDRVKRPSGLAETPARFRADESDLRRTRPARRG